MFIYADESGDTGFKFAQGSSRFFVVTLLLGDDPVPVQYAVDELRRRLGFSPRDEFRFSHSSIEVRRRFLQELRPYPFAVRAVVVDKARRDPRQVPDAETFYERMVKVALIDAGPEIAGATLILDQSVTSKRRRKTFDAFLRQPSPEAHDTRRLRRVAHHASHADSLIQAADMVSGAIYARFNRGDAGYLEIIRTKVERLWVMAPETL